MQFVYATLRRLGVDVRPAEAGLTLCLFFYCFLVGTFQFAGKAVRQSTFIDSLGAQMLPLVYFLVAVFAYPILRFYTGATRRFPWHRVVAGTVLLLAASLVLFWALFERPDPWIRFVFYIWISIATVMAMSQFWMFANRLYDPRQARRLFGLISAGGLLGGTLGGQIVRVVAQWGETRDALLAGAATLVLIAPLVRFTEGLRKEDDFDPSHSRSIPLITEDDKRSVFEVMKESRLLQLISAVMLLGIIAGQVIDLQFNWIVEQSTADLQERTVFFGWLYSIMGLSGFLFQLVVTSRIHRALGVGFAMKVLPTAAFLGTMFLMGSWFVSLSVVFWILAVLKVGENGLRYSLDQSTRELLFVAVPEKDRKKVKAWVDVLVQRLGKTLAALLLLPVTFEWLTPIQAGGITLVVCGFWLMCSVLARRDYVVALRNSLTNLEVEETRSRDSVPRIDDITALEVLVECLGSADPAEVLRSVDLLSAYGRSRLVPPLLLYHDDPTVRRRVLGVLADEGRRDALPLVEKLIADEDPDVRSEAIRSLARLSGRTGPLLMRPRLRDADLRVRSAAIACLANQGTEEMLAEAEGALVELITDADPEVRREAACALEEVREPIFQQYLVGILYDQEPKVAAQAIRAVAQRAKDAACSPMYIPILIALLHNRRVKHAAREALVAYGERVIPALEHFMNDPLEQIWVRRGLPKTLARLGTPSAQRALIATLGAADLLLRRKAVEALLAMDRRLPDELRPAIERSVADECTAYVRSLTRLLGVSSQDSFELAIGRVRWRSGVEPNLLQQLLAERIEGHLINLLDLLTLLSDDDEVVAVWRGLLARNDRYRGHALEYLDTVLPPTLRRAVLAVIDDLPIDERLRLARRNLGIEVRSRTETLRELVTEPEPGDETSPWISAAAMQLVASGRESSLYQELAQLSKEDGEGHPLLRETAQWALRSLR